MSFRTPESEAAYRAVLAATPAGSPCPLCAREPKETFAFWKIIENMYPYDRIATVHDLILPIRHVGEAGLTEEEKIEFLQLKGGYINEHYGYLLEPVLKGKTLPAHFHVHLLKSKFD